MSDTTGTGAGASAAPGWYADPNDPQQLRWWSGAAWTEHVSPRNPPSPAEAVVAQATAEPVAQPNIEPIAQAQSTYEQAAAAQPVDQQLSEQQDEQQPVAAQLPYAASTEQTASAEPAPLPSRRALREGSVASAVDPGAAPTAGNQPSTATAYEQPAYQQPISQQFPAQEPPAQEHSAQQPALIEPELSRPLAGQPTADQIAWSQAQAQAAAAAAAAAVAPPLPPASEIVERVANPAAAQPVAPAQSFNPAQDLLNQQAAAPTPNWGAPTAPLVTTPASTVDGLLAAAPGAEASPADTSSGQWSLTPTTRRGAAAAQAAQAGPSAQAAGESEVGSSTVWMWLIAISPIIAAALIGFAIATSGLDFTKIILPAAIVAPYLLVILFAVADRSRLATIGLQGAASWVFAALSAPVYLIVRAGVLRRETGKGGPGLIAWLICFVIAIAGFIGYGFVVGTPLVPGLPS